MSSTDPAPSAGERMGWWPALVAAMANVLALRAATFSSGPATKELADHADISSGTTTALASLAFLGIAIGGWIYQLWAGGMLPKRVLVGSVGVSAGAVMLLLAVPSHRPTAAVATIAASSIICGIPGGFVPGIIQGALLTRRTGADHGRIESLVILVGLGSAGLGGLAVSFYSWRAGVYLILGMLALTAVGIARLDLPEVQPARGRERGGRALAAGPVPWWRGSVRRRVTVRAKDDAGHLSVVGLARLPGNGRPLLASAAAFGMVALISNVVYAEAAARDLSPLWIGLLSIGTAVASFTSVEVGRIIDGTNKTVRLARLSGLWAAAVVLLLLLPVEAKSSYFWLAERFAVPAHSHAVPQRGGAQPGYGRLRVPRPPVRCDRGLADRCASLRRRCPTGARSAGRSRTPAPHEPPDRGAHR